MDEEPSQERIDEASAVAAGLVLAPFEVIFSRVMRFKGNGALVLLEDDGATALRAFRQALAQALTEAGVWHDSKGTLHMTLGYGGNDVSERLTEPVRWVAQGFVLIHSVRGKTEHRRLGRWPLAQPG